MVFEGTTGVFERIYREKWVSSKKEGRNMRIWKGFEEFFVCARLSINFCLKVRSESGYGFLEVWCENGFGKLHFLVWRGRRGSGFEEPGCTPPPRIPRSSPPGHLQRNFRLVDTRHAKKLISTWRSVIQLVIKHNANEQTSQILGGVDSRWDTYVAKFEDLSCDEN